jgi:hypothetical protein
MLSHEQIHAAIKPLRLIFWGGILWIFDLSFSTTSNGSGYRCDVLDDTVGTILIAIGVFRLSQAPVRGDYSTLMLIVRLTLLASIIETAMKHFIFVHPAPLDFLLSLLGLCQLTATILFLVAMKQFCTEANLQNVAASWQVTFLLFCFIYALPLGFMYLAALIALLGGTSFNVNLGAAGLLLLPVFAAPLIHFFVSTSRMRRAADSDVVQALSG